MDFLIVTGLSGAGKTQAAHYLEDLGYYCVDNMPSALLRQFAEFCIDSQGRFNKVALVADVRARESFDALFAALEGLKELDCTFRILFIEAPVAAIVRRYKESRRRPPLAEDGMTIEDAVKREIIEIYADDFRKIDPSGKATRMFYAVPAQLNKNASRYQISSVIEQGKQDRL